MTQFTLCPNCRGLAEHNCFAKEYICECGWKETDDQHADRLNLQSKTENPKILDKTSR